MNIIVTCVKYCIRYDTFEEIEKTKNCSNNFFYFSYSDRIFPREIQLARWSFGDGLNSFEFLEKFLEKRREGGEKKKEKIPSLHCKYLHSLQYDSDK